MAIFYLPSSTTGYSTDGQYVKFRIKVTEDYSSTEGKRLYCQLIAYRTNTGYETDGTGSVTWYLNGNSVGSTSWQYGDKPITNSSGTVMSSKYITLTNNATTAKITAKFTMSNTSVGTNTNGGTVNLTKYTVTYNANGGTNAPSSQKGCYNNIITLKTAKPTRDGYSFVGWSKTSNGNASYNSGDSYKITGNVTLYAVWEIATCTITYNANGGEGAPSNQTYTHASSGTVDLSATKPTRNGYEFVAWNTKSDGSGISYSSGGTFNKSNLSTTLYAIWEGKTYTITYNANGGSGAPSSHSYVYSDNDTDIVTLKTTIPTRSGYAFVAWNTSADGTGISYSFGEAFIKEPSNITLYAIWSKNTITMTLNANGGTVSKTSFTLAINGNSYSILSSYIPTRTGYDFLGWYTDASGGTQIYNAEGLCNNDGTYWNDNKCVYTKNYTLYAHWSIKQYTISYNMNGGDGTINNQTKTYGTDITLSTTKPIRQSYVFLGWSTNKEDTSTLYSAGGLFTDNENVVLYAIWQYGDESIYLYSTGKTEAIEFIEEFDCEAPFKKGGIVISNEFIESGESGVEICIDGNSYTTTEIIER